MDYNPYGAAVDPQANPQGFDMQRKMAQAMMQGGAQGPAGSPWQAAASLGTGLAGAYKMNQLRDAARASDILNGGAGTGPGMQNTFQKIGNLFSGFGG